MKASLNVARPGQCATVTLPARICSHAVIQRSGGSASAGKGFGSAAPTPKTPSNKPPPLHQQADSSLVRKQLAKSQPPPEVVEEADLPPGSCPCCSGRTFEACCQRYLTPGGPPAPTPEATLRARFTAFTKGSVDYLLATTHPDYLSFHYGHDMQTSAAKQHLADDTKAACAGWDYKGFKIAPPEPGTAEKPATKQRPSGVSSRGGSRRGADADNDVVLKFAYKVSPRSAALQPEREWETAVQELRFRKGSGSGLWQMTGYNQVISFGDATALIAKRQAEAEVAGAEGGSVAGAGTREQPRDWKLDRASRSSTKDSPAA